MISDLFAAGKPTLSFEVFPPKKNTEFKSAYETLDAMAALKPDFISCTYGAGGSGTAGTVELSSYIQNHLNIDALAHITCVGSRKTDILDVCGRLKSAGISHVLALRGDRPKAMTDEQFDSREFLHASDMVSYLKENTDFELAGACYPEKHFEASDIDADLANLQIKIRAGVSFLITQLFFDNDVFYAFEDTVREMGITLPICAGIMPVTTAKQLGTTVSLSGSSVPKKLADIIAKYGESADDMRKAGTDFAVRQILDLQDHGVHDIHIYSMNKAEMTAEIVNAIR